MVAKTFHRNRFEPKIFIKGQRESETEGETEREK